VILKRGKTIKLADLFCGAGGTTTGATEAIRRLGYKVTVTAVNHNPVAIETHTMNHPDARHLCTSVDATNPRELFDEGELDGLLGSPECMGHSNALGGRPINDQSRCTAWCVIRWLDALRPAFALFENVPEMMKWAPIGSNGRPLKSREGEVFEAWIATIRSLGYKVDYRKVVAADYGDPTTRCRLLVQCVRGRLKIVWPHATNAPVGKPTLFAGREWVSARRIIRWDVKGRSIFNRTRPLQPTTLERIQEGMMRFNGLPFLLPKQMKRSGSSLPISVDAPVNTVLTDGRIHLVEPFLIPQGGGGAARHVTEPVPTVACAGAVGLVQPFLLAMEHGQRVLSADDPVPTVTCAKGGAFGVVEPFIIQMNHGNKGNPKNNKSRVRSLGQPVPAICGNRGEWALIEPKPFILTYYGTGGARSVDDPVDTVTTKDRFGLVQPVYERDGQRFMLDILYRMFLPEELAAAQGFPREYRFAGTKTQVTKQIGNAVPRRMARAHVAAIVTQNPDVSGLMDDELDEASQAVSA